MSAWQTCPWCEGNGRNPAGDVTGNCPKCAGQGHWNPALRAVVILEADPEAVAAWFEGEYEEDEQQPAARDYFADRVSGLVDDEFAVATMFGPIHVREDDPA